VFFSGGFLSFFPDGLLTFVCQRKKKEFDFRNGRCGSATIKGVHFVPEYPTEIYTNITDKLRKEIKSPLGSLGI